MQRLLGLLPTITLALAGCYGSASGADGETGPAPQSGAGAGAALQAVDDFHNATFAGAAAAPGSPASPGVPGSPSRPPPAWDPGLTEGAQFTELELSAGRIDGDFGNYSIHGVANDNHAALDTWTEGTADSPQESYLFITIAAQTDQGMGMLIVEVPMGFDNALFSTGVATIEGAPGEDSVGPAGGVYVTGCSGPTVENVEWDMPALDFEVHAIDDDAHEGSVRIEVEAILGGDILDENGIVIEMTEPQYATGSISLTRP